MKISRLGDCKSRLFSLHLLSRYQSDSVSRALDCLFDTLKAHGKGFTPSFWSLVCRQILFPIFSILRSPEKDKNDSARFRSHEDMSVWLSTTLISALRNMIDLWTFYFEVMQEYLDGLLDILVACICQGESRAPSHFTILLLSFLRMSWTENRESLSGRLWCRC